MLKIDLWALNVDDFDPQWLKHKTREKTKSFKGQEITFHD